MTLRLLKQLSPLIIKNHVKLSPNFVFPTSRRYSSESTETVTTTTVHPQREVSGRNKDNPVVVASPTDKCIVGCCCSEEQPGLKWFYLEEGPTQVCDCGYYFRLERTVEGQWVPEYSQVMQVNQNRRDPRFGTKRWPFSKPKIEDVYVDPPKTKAPAS
ncbi:unnamed protein product [Clavelina lepadiformis]|uniref:Uncharacterized protein n=1 Tax=Clavelina lepadiformis TaxID=159417 RepID=A0ABP0GV46_CLALP